MGTTQLSQFEIPCATLRGMGGPRFLIFLLVAVTLSPLASATEGRAAPLCAEFDLSDVASSGPGISVDPGACLIVDIGTRSHEVTLAIDIEIMDDAMDVLMFDQNGIQTYKNGQNYRSSINPEASFESMIGSEWLDWSPPISINPKNWFIVFDNSAHDGDEGLGDQGGMVGRFKIQLAPAATHQYSLIHDTFVIGPNQVVNLANFAVDAETEFSYWVHPISGTADIFIQSDNQLGSSLFISGTDVKDFAGIDLTQLNWSIPAYLDLKNLNLILKTSTFPVHFSIKGWFNPTLSPEIVDYVNGITTVGEKIVLDARNTPNSLQQIEALSWDFDTDSIVDATGDLVEASWDSPGVKTVYLTAESKTGTSVQKTHQITVEDQNKPTAVITAIGGIPVDNIRKLLIDTGLTLRSLSSSDDHMIESVAWKINNTEVSNNSEYVFNSSNIGFYNIVLEVTDPSGNIGQSNIIVRVIDNSNPVLVSDRIKDIKSIQRGDEISLSVTAFDSDSSSDSLTITWDLDLTEDTNNDGDPSNDPDYNGSNITTSFSKLGENKFTVTVTDPSGNSDREILSVEVVEPPSEYGVFAIVVVIFAVFIVATAVVLFGHYRIQKNHAIDLLMQGGLTKLEANARINSISKNEKIPLFAKARQIAGIKDNEVVKSISDVEKDAKNAEFESIYGSSQSDSDPYAGFKPSTSYRQVDSSIAEAALAAFAEEPVTQPVATSAKVSGKVRSGGVALPPRSTNQPVKLTTNCSLCGSAFSVDLQPSQKSAIVSCPSCGADQLFER